MFDVLHLVVKQVHRFSQITQIKGQSETVSEHCSLNMAEGNLNLCNLWKSVDLPHDKLKRIEHNNPEVVL